MPDKRCGFEYDCLVIRNERRPHDAGSPDTQAPVLVEAPGEGALALLLPPGRGVPRAPPGGGAGGVRRTIARELTHLKEAGVLRSRAVGNQKHYALREDNPILEDLRNIFLKTSGASAELESVLEGIAGVEIAFIYGSYASGEAHAASDIDLMVIGDVSDQKLAPAVARVERCLKRRSNYTLYTRGEVERRRGKKGEFVHEVLAGPKVVLIGSTDDRLFRVA